MGRNCEPSGTAGIRLRSYNACGAFALTLRVFAKATAMATYALIFRERRGGLP